MIGRNPKSIRIPRTVYAALPFRVSGVDRTYPCRARFIYNQTRRSCMSVPDISARGLGVASNPPNRFEAQRYERASWMSAEEPAPQTEFLIDPTRSIITYNDSPDVPFDSSINPYRGCEHGCVYCFTRPSHDYLGFSAGLDFETRILVKTKAPELLRHELSSHRWKPQVLAMSAGLPIPTSRWSGGSRPSRLCRLEVCRLAFSSRR